MKPILYVLIATFLYGLGTVLLKIMTQSFSNFSMVFYSLLIALITVSIHIHFIEGWSFLKKINVKDFLPLILIGLFGTGLALYLLGYGISLQLAYTSALLTQTDILACMLLGYLFLKQKIGKSNWFCIILIITGIIVYSITFSKGFEFSKSTISLCFAGFFFGTGVVANGILTKKYTPIESTWFRLFIGAIVVLPTMLLSQNYNSNFIF